ncbi:hypothetical protein WG906_09050 [Pedobacter sp. P351]|uniref:hypothetical protein n=1 Tax=Pedobacter superstes TaxID=3133441 RepID=UPI00309FEE7F
MLDFFTLLVKYNDAVIEYDAVFYACGHKHSFHVIVDGIAIAFEPDVNQNYIAIINEEAEMNNLAPDAKIIQLISESIEEYLVEL